MFPAKIQHFLRFANAAIRAGQAATTHQQIERGNWKRLVRRSDEDQRAIALQQREIRVQVVVRGDGIQDEVEAAQMLLHFCFVFGDDDFIGAQSARILRFVGRSGEEDGVRAKRVGELQAHVAQSTETNNANLLALANLPVAQRRVGGDAGAKKRRRTGGIQIFGHAQDVGFIDDDAVRISTVRDAAEELVLTVVSKGHALFAILLQAGAATFAFAAGIDHAADGGHVAFLEFS